LLRVFFKELRIQGSFVGTRQDTIEALALAAAGKIKPHYTLRQLKDVNEIYDAMRKGELTARVVLDLKNND